MKNNFKVQSILVGVDFSKNSKSAVLQARTLAKKWKIPLVFVHGFEDPFVSQARFADIIEKMTDYYRKYIVTFYKVREPETVVVKCGRSFEQLLLTSKKFPRPLILVGHRGKNGIFSKMLIGSTAERVAQRATCPVWIHRSNKSFQPSKVLIPCDLSDRAAYTAEFIKKNGAGNAKIELFFVAPPPVPVLDYEVWQILNQEAKSQSAESLRKFQKHHPSLKIKQGWGNVFTEIEKHAKRFDLIALSPRHAKSFFQGFGSVTSKIARSSQKSVLIIP